MKHAEEVYAKVAEVVSPVHLVGGSVRDVVMGREPSDYDFATPLQPDEVETRVRAAGKRAYPGGKRQGTIGFKVDGLKVEVTTFRTAAYSAGRTAPQVEFVGSLEDDLARRDFTMNAMALGPEGVIDLFGGRADIEAGVVRAVGNARQRVKEDPLRMLRAARFVAQFGFAVEEATEAAAVRHAHRILTVARERWMIELDKLLVGPHVRDGLQYLARTRLLNFMLPELAIQVGYDQHSRWHDLTLWEHTLGVVESVPAEVELRWAALLHDVGKPFVRFEKPGRATYVKHDVLGAELVERLALALKWSQARREHVAELVRTHLEDANPLRAADNAHKKVSEGER